MEFLFQNPGQLAPFTRRLTGQKMDGLNVFQGFAIVLAIAFLSVSGSLLHESISNPAMQPWELLGGALLCSLGLMFAYLFWKQRVSRKYLD